MSCQWTLFHFAFQEGSDFQNGVVTEFNICKTSVWLVNYWFYCNCSDALQGFKTAEWQHEISGCANCKGQKNYMSKMLAWQLVPMTEPCRFKYTAGMLRCPLFLTSLCYGSIKQKLLNLHKLKSVDTVES